MTSTPDKYIPPIGSRCFVKPTQPAPCVAGPRKRPIPVEGCDHLIDLFMVRRILDGSLCAYPDGDPSVRRDDQPAAPGATRAPKRAAEKGDI